MSWDPHILWPYRVIRRKRWEFQIARRMRRSRDMIDQRFLHARYSQPFSLARRAASTLLRVPVLPIALDR